MRIAQQQNELAERQQALHEKQFALTEQQARFASIGASEQKWISDFQEMLAHLFELGFRASRIILRLKESSDQQETAQLAELNDTHIDAVNLIYRLEFHLGRERAYVRHEWVSMLLLWFFPNVKFDAQSFDQDVWSKKQRDIFERAQRIISEHEAKIPFNQTAAGQEEQELAALEKRAAGLHMEEQELAALLEKRAARLQEDLKAYGGQTRSCVPPPPHDFDFCRIRRLTENLDLGGRASAIERHEQESGAWLTRLVLRTPRLPIRTLNFTTIRVTRVFRES